MPLRVGIDGRCASGKTKLVDELSSSLAANWPEIQVLRPSVDGFHHPKELRYRQGEFSARGYYEDAYDYSAVIDAVLSPLSSATFPVWCKQTVHDWRTDMPHEAPAIPVGPNAVLLFEGIFVLRSQINRYWDLRILVDVDAEASIARAIQRDADGSLEVTEEKYRLRYEPAWQIYVDAEHPELKADLIVHNHDVQNPTISKCR
jgi:uridine kinase